MATTASQLTNEGLDLYFSGDVEGACAKHLAAWELTNHPIAAMNIGIALVHMGMFDASFPWLEKACRMLPDDRRTRTCYGEALFREGRWIEAWKHWFPIIENPFQGGGEQWNGQDLAGKEVLVTPAGGYGDVFMLARYIPEVSKRFGCNVSFAATGDMVPVFLKQPSMAGVNMTKPCKWDIWMHLFHFMQLFQFTPEMVAADWKGPYIEPMAIPHDETLRIGLKLAAGEKGDKFKFRSVPREIGDEFIASLPDNDEVELIGLTAGNPLVDGWLDTIALISDCDLVIAVDTSTLHLAAAMGKETWAILGDFNDAKWGKSGPSTVWYPTMRIFRGQGKGYRNSVRQVTEALSGWLLHHGRN